MNYKQILSRFKNKKILIIGDLILDHYVEGTVERISPEAPVPVVTVTKDDEYKLGGCGNVAHNVVALGAQASVIGIIGADPRGEVLKNLLKEKSIDTDGIVTTGRRTTVKTRIIAHDQQVVRVDREDNAVLDAKAFNTVRDLIKKNIRSFDAVIISDYKKGVISRELIAYVNSLAKKRGVTVAVDPKVGHYDFYRGVTLITPNMKEAAQMSHIDITDEQSLFAAGEKLMKELKCRAVLLTRGKEGMTIFEQGKRRQNIKTVAREVYDVTGAGDTVISAFTLAHVSGAPLKTAAVIANHAAGIVVGEVGTATATVQQIMDSFEQ